MDHAQDLLEWKPILFQEIGYYYADTATDSCNAMNQDIGLFPGVFNELKSILKMFNQLIPFVIFSRNVQIMRYIFFGMFE